ncbi:hypothetical protein PHAVU_011G029600 [Phaseolus vulgaris]|uniref:Uncharacterized protein n=1 Tax=Phaseolus vulgaris TaxID=3885 RepID=V7AHS6_PHAVU|nr:hypothetical protein PHAVU_011G029600g [Phaseolus vulgaris]ESW03626.1 hypothetical protein PHAVU_011G029600g [Phaseolus vulgaris]
MQIETRPTYEYDENLSNSEMMMMSSFASTSPPTLGYIQHPVSKLDTALQSSMVLSRHQKSFSLVTDSLERSDTMAGVAARKSDLYKRNVTLIRRNHKSESRQKSANRIAFTPCSKQVV